MTQISTLEVSELKGKNFRSQTFDLNLVNGAGSCIMNLSDQESEERDDVTDVSEKMCIKSV